MIEWSFLPSLDCYFKEHEMSRVSNHEPMLSRTIDTCQLDSEPIPAGVAALESHRASDPSGFSLHTGAAALMIFCDD